ncbi:putative manganese transporter [Alphaproteobacteria bacterium LSUCC0684]
MHATALPVRQIQSAVIVLMALFAFQLSILAPSGLTDVVLKALADAYIQVTSFVAATLFLFYAAEKLTGIDAEKMLAESRQSQVVMAAFLGALPGCGGAIIVITQYVTGRLSFGAVMAALTATMGDAAFLLIAQEPLTGLSILAMGFGVGVVSGYAVNALHGPDFLRQPAVSSVSDLGPEHIGIGGWLDRFWIALFIPGLVFGIMAALQIDIDALFGSEFLPSPSLALGAAGGILSVMMFLLPKILTRLAPKSVTPLPEPPSIFNRVIADTNFVTAWVVLAFLTFEVSVYVFDIDLKDLFSGYIVFAPMIAVLLGFLPGCGPQVLVTTLYLAGAIPLSAQIGNAISNDGDALFPAIAIAPKVAIIATLYSAIPALLIGYGWMFLVEMR